MPKLTSLWCQWRHKAHHKELVKNRSMMCTKCLRRWPLHDPIFKVGDKVERAEPRSYRFPGVVIGVNRKLDGHTIIYSVESVAEDTQGMVHEFNEKSLKYRDDGDERTTPNS